MIVGRYSPKVFQRVSLLMLVVLLGSTWPSFQPIVTASPNPEPKTSTRQPAARSDQPLLRELAANAPSIRPAASQTQPVTDLADRVAEPPAQAPKPAPVLTGLLGQPSQSNWQAAPQLQIVPQANENLQMTIQAPVTITVNSPITYTINYTNSLNTTLSNVTITTTFAGGQTFLTNVPVPVYINVPGSSTPVFTYTNEIARWRIASLPRGSGRIQIATVVSQGVEPQPGSNVILLGCSGTITTSTPNTTTSSNPNVSVKLVAPLLELAVEVTPFNARPNEILTYTLVLRNYDALNSAISPSGVVTNTLPANTSVVAIQQGGVYQPSSNKIVWNWSGGLAPGSQLVFTYQVRINPYNPDNSILIINNQCQAQAKLLVRIVNCGSGRGTAGVTPIIDKIASPSETFPASTLTYTLSFYNPLTRTLTSAKITDTINADYIEYRALITPGVTLTNIITNSVTKFPTLYWSLPSIPPLTEYRFQYRVYILGRAPAAYPTSNLEATSRELRVVPRSNIGSFQISRRIVMTKSVDTGTVVGDLRQNDVITYTINLNNVSYDEVTITELIDQLPFNNNSNFQYLQTVSGGLNPIYDEQTHQLKFLNLTVLPRFNRQIKFLVRVSGATFPYLHCNTASATSPTTSILPVQDNSACVSIFPPYYVDKYAMRTDNTLLTQATPGDVVRWKIIWLNDDVEPLINVTVQDYFLPPGFQFISMVSGPAPTTVDSSGRIITWQGITIPANGGRFEVTFDSQIRETMSGDDIDRGVFCNDTYLSIPSTGAQFHMLVPACIGVLPRVQIDVTVKNQFTLPNSTVEYDLTLRNHGAPMSGINLSNVIPGGVQYLGMTSGTISPTLVGQTLTWSNISLIGGSVQVPGLTTFKFRARVPAITGTYLDTASGRDTLDPIVYIKPGFTYLFVVDQLVTLQAASIPENVPPGGLVDHKLRITRSNNVPLNNLYITATLPFNQQDTFEFLEDLSFGTNVQPITITGQFGRKQIAWQNVPVPSSGILDMGMRLRASDLLGDYGALWDVMSPGSFNEPISAGAQTTVLPQITLGATVAPSSVQVGAQATYAITLTSLATQPIQNIILTHTLPSGVTYSLTTAGGGGTFSVSSDGRTLVWKNLSLPAASPSSPQSFFVRFTTSTSPTLPTPSCATSTLVGTSTSTVFPRVGTGGSDQIAELCFTNGGTAIRRAFVPLLRR